MLFSTGQVVITHNARITTQEANINVVALLDRYFTGDFGETSTSKEDDGMSDAEMNYQAAINGGDRIIAKYVENEIELFVITDEMKDITTVMLVSDY